MASVRITAQMRDELVRAIVQPKYEALEKDLKAREDALNAVLIQHLLPPKTVAILDAAPEGFFPENYQIYVDFKGDGHRRVELGSNRRLPFTMYRNTVEISDTDIIAEHFSIVDGRIDNAEDRKKEETQIRAVITSSATAQKLRAVWPEITPYIEKICQVTIVPGLPAVILEDLNKKFNLPPTEE